MLKINLIAFKKHRFIIEGMKPVTIDKLNLEDHVRWAKDQTVDVTFVRQVGAIPTYPDIAGKSAIYASQLEALFDWDKGIHAWAHFVPPDSVLLFSRRFFSFRLFPNIHWEDTGDEEEREEDKKEDKDLIQELLCVHKIERSPAFEREKDQLLSLLEAIRHIDSMLAQISGRKLQYQKG